MMALIASTYDVVTEAWPQVDVFARPCSWAGLQQAWLSSRLLSWIEAIDKLALPPLRRREYILRDEQDV